jgi:hypothetical protein
MNAHKLPKVRITRTANMYKRSAAMVMDPIAEQEHPYIPLNSVYIGIVAFLPKVGQNIICCYDNMNGVDVSVESPYDTLISTPVTSIDGDNYHTQNSVYKIELLDAN